MKRQLPSFPSLRAFESAARNLSFKSAATELCVTQSAISHQVKILEDFLAAPLFIRHPQRVELTLRGSDYLQMVSHMLDDLDTATQKIKHESIKGPLYLETSAAFASYWLLPRMLRFNQSYPEVEINLSTIATGEAPTNQHCDIRVNCSWEVPPEAGGERFMDTPHVPVCSPELLLQGPGVSEITDLFQYPILRAEGSWDLWDRWFRHHRFEAPSKMPGLRFENTYLTLKAAEEGLGIALGPIALIREKVDLGRLVILLDLEGARALYFTLSCPQNWRQQPRIVAFRNWLHRELGNCSGLEIFQDKLTSVGS